MSDTSPTRIWFLDWYGHIIDHDPIRDELIRRPFTSGEYPDLFLLAPVPLRLPMTAVLRKRSSLPHNVPSELELVDAADGLVALRDKERDLYFSINPRNELTHFNANNLLGWERFIPVTLEILNGLSNLIDPTRASVTDGQNKPCEPLRFEENCVAIGDFRFTIVKNAEALTTIGNLEPGKETKVNLKGAEGSATASFTIRKKADGAA